MFCLFTLLFLLFIIFVIEIHNIILLFYVIHRNHPPFLSFYKTAFSHLFVILLWLLRRVAVGRYRFTAGGKGDL